MKPAGKQSDDDCSGIDSGPIMDAWSDGQTIWQIAQTTSYPIKVIKRELKRLQKEIVEKRYGRGNKP